ncbi:class I SAM-dependent methyltransferase [Methanothermococcus thermolithotrophicus]|jgi:2-polyprenyl-3-methyl-5-hydroxy-6-metoxy-1,4-benzoquinol methylase/predicted RNA-binding Zn-ribbon protein involved in translation (DUF1610 family)|uniref:class I SAM-dependent methyltransferase n=1 Tax=Methanothermococcus thermolithotrophicus TaxID=2186 RepID=UPI00035E4490|nr:class I SAM-dependent methyltransferase [Methanothermococcus thermolithotrophicus]
MNSNNDIKCPICGNNPYYKFTKTNLLGSFKFYECKNCGLLFVNPTPTKEMLDFYYSKIFTLPNNQKLKNINKFSGILKMLNTDITNKKVLDIGSGKGDIIKCFYNSGVKEIVGVDIDKDLIKLKDSILDEKIDVIIGDFLNVENNLKNEYFNIITMFDVIEHFTNPKTYLEKALSKLKKGGKIIITTPNMGSLNYKICGKYWDWVSPPAHLHYFSPKSLTLLLNEFGIYNIQTYSFYGDWEDSLILSTLKLPCAILKYHIKCLALPLVRTRMLNNIRNQKNNKNYGDKSINLPKNLDFLKCFDKYIYNSLSYPHLMVVGEKQ